MATTDIPWCFLPSVVCIKTGHLRVTIVLTAITKITKLLQELAIYGHVDSYFIILFKYQLYVGLYICESDASTGQPKVPFAVTTNESHILQGCQLFRIERESPAWTLFLPRFRQAYKVSSIANISPVKSCETYKISRIRM